MEVQDGFIVGVYNYCDRWCEICRFTSRCRVFADTAMHEAMSTSDLKPVADAPPHPSDIRPPSKWLEEALADFDESSIPEIPDPPPLPARHAAVVGRAKQYTFGFFEWLESSGFKDSSDVHDPLAVVIHFSALIASKTHRAMTGLNEDDGCRDYPPDFEGTARLVLDGIERSLSAWKDLALQGKVAPAVAANFINDLVYLMQEIDALVPKARAFVRPGFDEPDEVARLEATDWS